MYSSALLQSLLLALVYFAPHFYTYHHVHFRPHSIRNKKLFHQASKSELSNLNDHNLLPSQTPTSPSVSSSFEVYEGMPLTDYDEIYQGVVLEELGLTLLVADSILTQGGKGLFLALISPPPSTSPSTSSVPDSIISVDVSRNSDGNSDSNQLLDYSNDNNNNVDSEHDDNDHENIERVDIPSGQILCGYSKGTFTSKTQGDKCVGYAFNNISTNLVIYNKKLVTIADMLTDVLQNNIQNNSLQLNTAIINDVDNEQILLAQVKHLMRGHEISLLKPSTQQIQTQIQIQAPSSLSTSVIPPILPSPPAAVAISANSPTTKAAVTVSAIISSFLSKCRIDIKSDFSDRYFVPNPIDDANIESQVSISNMGMYANDLAYNSQDNTYMTSMDTISTTDANANEINNIITDNSAINNSKSDSNIVGNSISNGSYSDNSNSSNHNDNNNNINNNNNNNNNDNDNYTPIKFLSRNILQLVWRIELEQHQQLENSKNSESSINSSSKLNNSSNATKRKLLRPKKAKDNNISASSIDGSDNSSSGAITYTLAPTWPVVIFSQDISFMNTEPNEIGLSYSYNYWQALVTSNNTTTIK